MIYCAEHNQTGGTPCKIYPVTLCFVCPRYSRSFPSAAAHGGRAVRAAVIRNPSNSARAQRRGGHRISPRFWRSLLPGRRKNESRFFPRLFVRHTRMGAGSAHLVKATPCRAASRALTRCPCFPAMDACGRRTRKPPAGARSKEARSSETQRQRHKNTFLISRGYSSYRHTANTIHTNLPRRMLRRAIPIHTPLLRTPPPDTCAAMCIMLTMLCAAYRPNGLRMTLRFSPHTVSACAGCLSGAVSIPTNDTPDTTPLHT